MASGNPSGNSDSSVWRVIGALLALVLVIAVIWVLLPKGSAPTPAPGGSAPATTTASVTNQNNGSETAGVPDTSIIAGSNDASIPFFGGASTGLGPTTANGKGFMVPNVLSLSPSAAKARLRAAGWSFTIVNAPSTASAPGHVFAQKPGADDFVPARVSIQVWVSTGAPATGYPYPRPQGNP
jgi:hypothetical protein